MGNRGLSVFLNGTRAASALVVLFGHAWLHSFGQSDAVGVGRIASMLSMTSRLAHPAVIAFFVISGYLVGGKLFFAGRPGFALKYSLDRATRIYTVALPALLIGFALVRLQIALFGLAYKITPGGCAANPVDVVAGLLFVPQAFGWNICYDSPIWSLLYEVFYYAFFASVALAWTRRGDAAGWVALAAAILLGCYGLFAGAELWAFSTFWLIGMAAAQQAPLRGRGLILTLVIAGLLILQAVLRVHDPLNRSEYLTAAAITAAILLLRRYQLPPLPAWLAGVAGGGAAISYSLYMMHAPAMNLTRAIVERGLGWQLGKPVFNSGVLAAWILFSVVGALAGVLGWWLFERHTAKVRAWVERRAGIQQPQRHQPLPDDPAPAREDTIPANQCA